MITSDFSHVRPVAAYLDVRQLEVLIWARMLLRNYRTRSKLQALAWAGPDTDVHTSVSLAAQPNRLRLGYAR